MAAGGEAEAQLEQRRAELPRSKEIQGYAADFREFLMVRQFQVRPGITGADLGATGRLPPGRCCFRPAPYWN